MALKKKSKSPTPAPVLYPFTIEEELDLHGMAVDEAMAAAEQFLERYENKPGTILRIIHGHSNIAPDSIRKSLQRNFATVWKHRIKRHRLDVHNPGATLLEIAG